MTALDIHRGFARNDALANARLFAACARLTDGEYEAKRVSFFPSLRETLEHLYLVDIYYFDALVAGGRGRSVFADRAELGAFERLRAAQHAIDGLLIGFVDALGEAAGASDPLAREVRIERRTGFDVERVGDVLLHLYEHQIHHRGQVHAMLSGSSVAPPQLDEYFLHADRLAADRELAGAGFPPRTREI